MGHFDLVIVGGGIAGATLGRSMALVGAHVLIVEKEEIFGDRIRGEILMPWGSAEAKTLGIYDLLHQGCGNEVPGEIMYTNGVATPMRNFRSTTPQGNCGLSFYHPEMQELLLREAMSTGVEVRRGARMSAIRPGPRPEADIIVDGATEHVSASLIVGADGRDSHIATMLNFERSRDPTELFIGGLQLSGDAPIDNALNFFLHGESGRGAIIIRTKPRNYRAYLLHHKDALPRRLSGARDYTAVRDHFRETGVPQDWLEGTTAHGIFATFEGAHRWIGKPCREGFVLIGDAAGASDPVWGNGLSRTLRDVRLLRDRLSDDRNWARAAEAYALDHDDQFQRLRRAERLQAALFFTMGKAGEAQRNRAFKLFDQFPGLFPDTTGIGPDAPLTEDTIELFLGRKLHFEQVGTE